MRLVLLSFKSYVFQGKLGCPVGMKESLFPDPLVGSAITLRRRGAQGSSGNLYLHVFGWCFFPHV